MKNHEKPTRNHEKPKNQPGTMNNHKAQPGTIKNQKKIT